MENSGCITVSFDIQKIFVLCGSLWPLFCKVFEMFELTDFFCVLLTGWLVSMMKDHVFVHIFFAYFCSRIAASFSTVVCVTDFAIICVFISVIYVYLRTKEDCCSAQEYWCSTQKCWCSAHKYWCSAQKYWCSGQKHLCLPSSTNVWNWSPVKELFPFDQIYLGLCDIRMFNFYAQLLK